MQVAIDTPARAWSFVVEALAELGRSEMQRRDQRQADETRRESDAPRADDQQAQAQYATEAQV